MLFLRQRSLTKYIGGHTDVLAGALCFNDSKLYDKLYDNMRNMGNLITPFDAFLAIRGAKTIELRVMKSCENAMTVAKWLEKHPKIENTRFMG